MRKNGEYCAKHVENVALDALNRYANEMNSRICWYRVTLITEGRCYVERKDIKFLNTKTQWVHYEENSIAIRRNRQ